MNKMIEYLGLALIKIGLKIVIGKTILFRQYDGFSFNIESNGKMYSIDFIKK